MNITNKVLLVIGLLSMSMYSFGAEDGCSRNLAKTGDYNIVDDAIAAILVNEGSSESICPICNCFLSYNKMVIHLHSHTHFGTKLTCKHCQRTLAYSTVRNNHHKKGKCVQ